MIEINGEKINIDHFPDGTLLLKDVALWDSPVYTIVWDYNAEEETSALYYLTNHIREIYGLNVVINLIMPYAPNARMDRVHYDTEVFTMKYFARLINSLNFNSVWVLDAHSNVTPALLERFHKIDVESNIKSVVDMENPYYIYFPDDGAFKRYKDLKCFEGKTFLYGKKNRNWEDGTILGISILDAHGEELKEPLEPKKVLMIDDIISYGGTLAYSADKLHDLGADGIAAYASHTENSIFNVEKGTLLKRLENGTVSKIYTTNSIFHITDENRDFAAKYLNIISINK